MHLVNLAYASDMKTHKIAMKEIQHHENIMREKRTRLLPTKLQCVQCDVPWLYPVVVRQQLLSCHTMRLLQMWRVIPPLLSDCCLVSSMQWGDKQMSDERGGRWSLWEIVMFVMVWVILKNRQPSSVQNWFLEKKDSMRALFIGGPDQIFEYYMVWGIYWTK